MDNRKIDIIIPVYNTPDEVLVRCLNSIVTQTIIEDIEVTIIDDASTIENYNYIIELFKPYMKINLLRYKINSGPGVARQYGLDHTYNEYIIFADVDDIFSSPFAINSLRVGIESDENKYQICVAVFDEILEYNLPEDVKEKPVIIEHAYDMVWLFGKIYRRCFLNQYNIRFHPTARANEDCGFNSICYFILEDTGLLINIPAHVYYWLDNPNSITRLNNHEYTYSPKENAGLHGFVENIIYAINKCQSIFPNSVNILRFAAQGMLWIYHHYVKCYYEKPEYLEASMKWCSKFYHECYSKFEHNITEDIIEEKMLLVYTTSHIPFISFEEFLKKCREKSLSDFS